MENVQTIEPSTNASLGEFWRTQKHLVSGGSQGGGNPGVMGVLRKCTGGGGETETETGYPRGRESGEIGNEFCDIVQYFAIEKSTQRQEPLREYKVQNEY